MTFAVSAFYEFVALPGFAELRLPLLRLCKEHTIRGTILLAAEGINGTIAGDPGDVAGVLKILRGYPEFSGIDCTKSGAREMPFKRMKVRLKKEIVTLGIAGIDPTRAVGRYVAPEDWNALISDPDIVVIDARNAFEVAAGTFRGAVNPGTQCFGDFPEYARSKLAGQRDRKIALFCTGGIRCEKATSFLLQEGFAQVFHLKGGILKYLEVVPPEQSLWVGECFVFDERRGLGHGLSEISNVTDSCRSHQAAASRVHRKSSTQL